MYCFHCDNSLHSVQTDGYFRYCMLHSWIEFVLNEQHRCISSIGEAVKMKNVCVCVCVHVGSGWGRANAGGWRAGEDFGLLNLNFRFCIIQIWLFNEMMRWWWCLFSSSKTPLFPPWGADWLLKQRGILKSWQAELQFIPCHVPKLFYLVVNISLVCWQLLYYCIHSCTGTPTSSTMGSCLRTN